MRRTGAASVASLISWSEQATSAEQHPVGDASHCPLHGAGPCVWVTGIVINFTSTQVLTTNYTSNGKTYIPSGRRFNGQMIVSTINCQGLTGTLAAIPVFSGGRIDPPSSTNIPQPNPNASPPVNNDTSVVGGSHNTGTQQTGGGVPGFSVSNTNMPGRCDVEIHQGNNSTGCIVIPDSAKWDIFRAAMAVQSAVGVVPAKRCRHHPTAHTVTTTVNYKGVTPIGNDPPPP